MRNEERENRYITIVVFILLLIPLVFSNCKPRVPRKFLSPSKMEAILYDYHLAEAAMSFDETGDTLLPRVYRLAVLKKHGVSEADFDSSMVYYTRHADRLHDIYEHLAKKLTEEALALGASASEINQVISISGTGDTTNIWPGDRSVILFQHPGYNAYSFLLKADSTFQTGDAFALCFDTKFIFQDGVRDGVALLSVKFANDSVASQMARLSVDSRFRVDIADDDRLGIKELSGYFLLNRNANNDSRTTLKVMNISNLSLLRMHREQSNGQGEKKATDSLSVPRSMVADSDSVPKRKLVPPIKGPGPIIAKPATLER